MDSSAIWPNAASLFKLAIEVSRRQGIVYRKSDRFLILRVVLKSLEATLKRRFNSNLQG
jgi:hypothetical protein